MSSGAFVSGRNCVAEGRTVTTSERHNKPSSGDLLQVARIRGQHAKTYSGSPFSSLEGTSMQAIRQREVCDPYLEGPRRRVTNGAELANRRIGSEVFVEDWHSEGRTEQAGHRRGG